MVQTNNVVTKDFLENRLNKFKTEVVDEVVERISDNFDRALESQRSKFLEDIDPILKEVTTAREERTLIENRVEKLEEAVFAA
ncbi:MAG: hypothetical protein AAB546_01710 [Patescibacteria group bacterium]